jgi:hypothetical protein
MMMNNMKKISLLILLLLLVGVQSNAQAQFMVGASVGSWQEKIPVTIASALSEAPTTFTASSIGVQYEMLFSKRYQYQVGLNYYMGRADLQKLENVVVPRRKMTSIWLANSLAWRMTKTFSFGPQIVINQTTVDLLDPSTSLSLFMAVNYDIFDDTRFVQTFGTVGNSGQLAYTVGLTRSF